MLNISGKRANLGKTSPKAVFASFAVLSVVAIAGMYVGSALSSAGQDSAAAAERAGGVRVDPADDWDSIGTTATPVALGSRDATKGWETLTSIGYEEPESKSPAPGASLSRLLPGARQDAASWMTGNCTIWLYGGLGDFPSTVEMAPFATLNIDMLGFRTDMWKGQYLLRAVYMKFNVEVVAGLRLTARNGWI